MKKSILLFVVLSSLWGQGSLLAQTIRRCNNNVGISGVNVYTTIQAAHDAAVAGDIIYVEPSGTNYGALVATKRLTIIGNGYFLTNPNTPFDKRMGIITSVSFMAGTNSSVIMGVAFGSMYIYDSNILVSRCGRFASGYGINLGWTTNTSTGYAQTIADNTTVSQCYDVPISENGVGYSPVPISATVSRSFIGTIIKNNINCQIYYLYNCVINNNVMSGITVPYYFLSTCKCLICKEGFNKLCKNI